MGHTLRREKVKHVITGKIYGKRVKGRKTAREDSLQMNGDSLLEITRCREAQLPKPLSMELYENDHNSGHVR